MIAAYARSLSAALLLAVLVLAVMAPAPSLASASLGQTGNGGASCPANVTMIQLQTATVPPTYAAPDRGVITSWSYLGGQSDEQVHLDVVRPTLSPGTFLLVAQTPAATATAGEFNTYSTRLPVSARDMLGLTIDGPSTACDRTTGSASDTVGSCTSCATTGGLTGTTISSTNTIAGVQLNVSAVLEPDVDGDGYGDETQDGCPGDPNIFAGPCQADLALSASGPATAAQGTTFAYTVMVHNAGTSDAQNVVITATLPSGVTFAPNYSDARCGGGPTVTCTLPSIMKAGSDLSTTIGVLAVQQGPMLAGFSVSDDVLDPNPGNNVGNWTTTIGPPPPPPPPPFLGLAITDQTLVLSAKGAVHVVAQCPAGTVKGCSGRLVLASKSKVSVPGSSKHKKRRKSVRRVLTLGSAKVSLAAGRTKGIVVKLNKTAQTVIARAFSLETTAKADTQDGLGQHKATAGDLLLVPGAKPKPRHHKRHH